jgi:outer membrane protein assembly factor BamB
VPFITVFLPDAISAVKRGQILRALSAVKKDAALLRDLESRDGFIMEGQDRGAALDWPDWRGANRDGRVPLLPNRLPERPRRVWKKTGMDGALAGISVAEGKVFLAERDLGDEFDVFRCLNAADGETVWTIEFPARGRLDYGQSPRATPVIHGGRAYLLGAFGDLRCVDAANGKLVWERQLIKEFGARLPT